MNEETELKTLRNIVLALAAAAAVVTTDASAQFPGGQGGSSRRGGAGGPPRGDAQDSKASTPSDTPASLLARVQQLLDRLEDDLRITNAQQSAWDAYAARIVRLADDIARERFAVREASNAQSSALQQFDAIALSAQQRATALQDIAEAGRALYATLGAEQRPIADRRLTMLVRALASGAATPSDARRDEKPSSGASSRGQ